MKNIIPRWGYERRQEGGICNETGELTALFAFMKFVRYLGELKSTNMLTKAVTSARVI